MHVQYMYLHFMYICAGAAVVTATVAGGAASSVVSAGLGRVITSVPQFTLAFNAVALSTLAYIKPFAPAPVSLASNTGQHTSDPTGDPTIPQKIFWPLLLISYLNGSGTPVYFYPLFGSG